MKRTQPTIAGFEDGRIPPAEECGGLERLKDAGERTVPWHLQNGIQPMRHLDLSPGRPMSLFGPTELQEQVVLHKPSCRGGLAQQHCYLRCVGQQHHAPVIQKMMVTESYADFFNVGMFHCVIAKNLH